MPVNSGRCSFAHRPVEILLAACPRKPQTHGLGSRFVIFPCFSKLCNCPRTRLCIMLFGLNIVFWLLFWTEYYVLALCICCLQQSQWPRGVTVSTLDSESIDRGSNPREAFLFASLAPRLQWPSLQHKDLHPQCLQRAMLSHWGRLDASEVFPCGPPRQSVFRRSRNHAPNRRTVSCTGGSA